MGSTCWNSSLQALQKCCSVERSCRKSQGKTKVFYRVSDFPYSFSFDFLVEACGDFIEKTSLWSILSDMWQQEPKDRQLFHFLLSLYVDLVSVIYCLDMMLSYLKYRLQI